jgi:peptide/nickel transport system substrate-binding protein
MKMTRRQALAGVAGMGLLATTSRMAWAAGGEIKRGGKLAIVLEVDVKSLDPLMGNVTVIDRHVYNLFAESLLQQDEKGELKPWLAETWKVENGGKTITFKLRDGMTFHDGTPVNAEAAKFCLERVIDPKVANQNKQYVTAMKSVDVIDPLTIKVNLDSPQASFLAMMANEPGIVVSPTALKERGDAFARAPIGSGPFMIKQRETGHVLAVRNEKYWRKAPDGKPLPYLDEIDMTVNPDSSVRLLSVLSGTAQLCEAVGTNSFDRAKASKDAHLVDFDLGAAFVTSFNTTRKPFDNIDARKAGAMALDREAMVKIVTGGNGVALKGIEPPASWVYDDKLRGHTFDPEQAKALFKKSGVSGPITLLLIQRDPDKQIAEMMQAMLGEAGFKVELAALERTAFLERVKKMDYDIALTKSLPMQRPDPHIQYAFAYSRVATFNYPGMKDEDIFNLTDQAAVELDQQKRKALYVQIQQMVLDRYYQSFLLWNPTREVASNKLNNIVHDATGIWRYEEMWLG